MSYTSAQLRKVAAAGHEIRITIAGEPTGGRVAFEPRRKGDKTPWVYTAPSGNKYAYGAKHCAPVIP